MAHRKDSLVIRSRVDVRTAAQKELFLNTLANVHNVLVACKILGLSRNTVYLWRKDDLDFAEQWDYAIEYSKEALESAAYLKIAQSFNDARRRISMPEAKLTEMFLNGFFPEKYRQRIDMNTTLEVTINWSNLPDEVLDKYLAKELTLEDVYQISLQQTAGSDSTAGSGTRTSEERTSEESRS